MNADEGKLACPFCGDGLDVREFGIEALGCKASVTCKSCGIDIRTRAYDYGEAGRASRELRTALDSLCQRTMPDGMKWPMWEDGSKVRIGDEFTSSNFKGSTNKVEFVTVGSDTFVASNGIRARLCACTHVASDTQERIDADAEKDTCDYWGVDAITLCKDCFRKKLRDDCDLDKIRDLLRRQRELDKREKRDEHQPD